MKKGLTEIVFILDESGSMAHLTADTIGGFNSLIERQKEENGGALISAVLFNSESKVIYDRVPLEKVRGMTKKDYCPGGSTALLDAVGSAVKHISNIHKYAREEDIPEHTMFVITTDGMENSSRTYTAAKVKKMITDMQEKRGWEFIFLGANIDAAETAGTLGIAKETAVDYKCDAMGTGILYDSVCNAVSSVRKGRKLCNASAWRESIDRDMEERG